MQCLMSVKNDNFNGNTKEASENLKGTKIHQHGYVVIQSADNNRNTISQAKRNISAFNLVSFNRAHTLWRPTL